MRAGELIYFMVSIVFILFVAVTEIDAAIRRNSEIGFMHSFCELISSVIHHYYRTGDVSEAVSCASDDVRAGNRNGRNAAAAQVTDTADRLVTMLRAGNTEALVGEYMESDANRYLKLFVSVAAMVSENGDTGDHEVSDSVFIRSVMQMKKEVREEERRLVMRKHAFSGLSLLASVPVLSVPFIAGWCSDTVSGLTAFYYGRNGGIIRLILLLLTIGAYASVVFLRDGRWKLPRASETGPGGARKLICSVFLFAVTLTVTVASHAEMRKILTEDVSEIENSLTVADSRVVRATVEYTPIIMRSIAEGSMEPSYDELTEALLKEPGIRKRETAELIAGEVMTRYERYKREHFDVWDIVISLVMAVIGWLLPDVCKAVRGTLSGERRNDELMHFCTLIHMQKSIPGMSAVRLLESIENAAVYYKRAVSECLSDIGISEKDAYETMRTLGRDAKLGGIADSFEMIEEVGIERAFTEISAEITEFSEDRRSERRIAEENEGLLARLISVIPGGLILFGYLVMPFIIGALRMFTEYSHEMEGMLG